MPGYRSGRHDPRRRPGNDDLFGQAGKDNLLAKNAGTDRLNGGTGRDSGSWNKKDQAKSVEKRLR